MSEVSKFAAFVESDTIVTLETICFVENKNDGLHPEY